MIIILMMVCYLSFSSRATQAHIGSKWRKLERLTGGLHRSIPDSPIQGQTFALKAAEHSTSMFLQPAAFILIFFN